MSLKSYQDFSSQDLRKENLIIGFDRFSKLTLWMRDGRTAFPAVTSEELEARLIGWNYHCWTWQVGGEFRVGIEYI